MKLFLYIYPISLLSKMEWQYFCHSLCRSFLSYFMYVFEAYNNGVVRRNSYRTYKLIEKDEETAKFNSSWSKTQHCFTVQFCFVVAVAESKEIVEIKRHLWVRSITNWRNAKMCSILVFEHCRLFSGDINVTLFIPVKYFIYLIRRLMIGKLVLICVDSGRLIRINEVAA